MTEQEQQLITGLADQIRNAPAPQIDRDANNLIQRTIGSRPDALYVLTQTVLVQQMALDQAKAQIDELRRQAPQPESDFLPRSSPQGYQGGYRGSNYQGSGYQSSQYAPPPPQAPPLQQAPPPQSGGGFSGFLHNVATTAAGVIAGDMAFDALSSLFGGHRGYGGGGFLGGGGGETIVNNYYEDGPRDRDSGDDSRFAQAADQDPDQNISPDIDDERDNSGDSFDDNSSSDDSSSFDDSSD
jgi:hypothetical protein